MRAPVIIGDAGAAAAAGDGCGDACEYVAYVLVIRVVYPTSTMASRGFGSGSQPKSERASDDLHM